MSGVAHVGTSGYHYDHWRGVFYPSKLPKSAWLDYYAQHLDSLEINNTFYQLPAATTFERWVASVPDDFLFIVKASGYITHRKRLNLDRVGLSDFFERVEHLRPKLGPILFQLPPRWGVRPDRLEAFLNELPKGHRYVFEFRTSSWYDERVYELLRAHDAAFCIYELAGHQSPIEVTASFVYVRLHGPGANKYEGLYSNEELARWVRRARTWMKRDLDVYFYFDNDQRGYAVQNAIALDAKLRGSENRMTAPSR